MYQSSLVAKICRTSASHYESSSGRWSASFLLSYTSIVKDYDEPVLPSITTENLKAATFGLILDDGSLTCLTFEKEFTEAVEAKQVAQQEAKRARFVVEKAEQKKKAAISTESDSKAAELIATSLVTTGDGLIKVCKLEAAEDIAYQLSRSWNITYLPAGQSVVLQLPQ
ncbi:prohibitin [Sigmodon hispidus]